MINQEQIAQLQAPLPAWAIKQHPSKTYLSVINPMAVIDRLNEVFGMGAWHFTTEYLSCDAVTTSSGKTTYMSAVKGRLEIPILSIVLEQYGGSTNEDKGDALKGGGTDALTKIASYLGVGASIYKGQGNIAPTDKNTPTKPTEPSTALPKLSAKESALKYIEEAKTIAELQDLNGKIAKSKTLSSDEKKECVGIIMSKLDKLDPLTD